MAPNQQDSKGSDDKITEYPVEATMLWDILTVFWSQKAIVNLRN